MKKLFIIPILFAIAFSQPQSNQILYTIYTNGKVFNNVVLHAVQDSNLLVNVNNSTKKIQFLYIVLEELETKKIGQNQIENLQGVFMVSV